MSRKRRMFDIDLPASVEIETGKIPDRVLERRRGPMATAIAENAEALREGRSAEDTIREENDRLAHELVRLRKEGLVTENIPIGDVAATRLIRDRKAGPDDELDELKTSIRDIGLSNPIRVERLPDGRFELIQGMRRLMAYRALRDETGDDRYARIPAGIVEPDRLEASYRRMVDENLVRKDISFAEMGALARAYAEDPANGCEDVDKAVAILFKSASYTKRSYIRAFAALTQRLDKVLEHATAIPRNVGVELKRRLDADPALIRRVSAALLARPGRSAEEEVAILRGFLEAEGQGGMPPEAAPTPAAPRRAKTTFQVHTAGGVAKCAASNGRLDLRCDLDFSRLDRAELENAVAALLARLSADRP